MIKRLFIITANVLLAICFVTSCSSDDTSDDATDSFLVNGETCKIYDASCSFHGTIRDDLGEFEIPPHASFTMQLEFDETLYYFSFSIDDMNSEDRIQIGKNLVSDGAVDVNGFRRLTSAELSTRYSDESGKLTISKKGNGYVIVDFSNFSFIKDTGKSETKYTLKGDVKFYDINAN